MSRIAVILLLLLLLLLARTGAAVRRVALTFALAVVLSAIEIDRRPALARPTPVVLLITEPPPIGGRGRPYRAHHRYAQPSTPARW